jgi:hypothetical protein
MPHSNIIDGQSDDEVWKIIGDQLSSKDDNLDYTAEFTIHNRCINLDIDIHPDRGDENEKPVTSFCTPLPDQISFRFTVEKQGFKHHIGKLFGTQDVIIGHPEFDNRYLIQSNDPAKVKEVLSDVEINSELIKHPIVNFEIRERKIAMNTELVLLLDLEGALIEIDKLKSIFESFNRVLNYLH